MFLQMTFSSFYFYVWLVFHTMYTYIYIYTHTQSERGFPGGPSSKESACQCRRHTRHRFDRWVSKILWSRKWQRAPVFLPGKFHGQRSLSGYSPQGRIRVRHDWAHTPKKRSRKQASVITSSEKILEASIIFYLPHPPPGGTSLSCLMTWLILGTVD